MYEPKMLNSLRLALLSWDVAELYTGSMYRWYVIID